MIVVTTPTGTIGSRVLAGLLQVTTTPLRVIARDPGRLPLDLPAYVEVVCGQTNDPAVLRQAFAGASALFWCQPDTPTANDYVGAYEAWSRVARDAIIECDVPRVVAISGAGEKPKVPAGPASALHRMEEIFSETSASLRFLRCGNFFSNILANWNSIATDGTFSSSIPGKVPAPNVAVEDIARVAVDLLTNPNWDGSKGLQMIGPKDLSNDEIAAELTRRLGKPIRYHQVPAETFKADLILSGMSPSAAQGLIDISNYLENDYSTAPDVDRSLSPTSFSQWLDDVVKAQPRT